MALPERKHDDQCFQIMPIMQKNEHTVADQQRECVSIARSEVSALFKNNIEPREFLPGFRMFRRQSKYINRHNL